MALTHQDLAQSNTLARSRACGQSMLSGKCCYADRRGWVTGPVFQAWTVSKAFLLEEESQRT